jgi:putative endonuclease
MQGFVYFMASHSPTLYVGVTSDLRRRVHQHKTHSYAGSFTSQYRVTRLVYFEAATNIAAAIAREKQIKGWRRSRKIALIERSNPDWRDLAESWYQDGRDQVPRFARDDSVERP